MKRVSISEAKNSLSALIDRVKSGSPVLIMDRGRPVARIEAVTSGDDVEQDGRLARLIRAGIVRPGRKGRISRSFFTDPPARLERDVSVVDIVIEERRNGR